MKAMVLIAAAVLIAGAGAGAAKFAEPEAAPQFRGGGGRGPQRESLGDAEGIMIEEKTCVRIGATDPRRSDGQAIGY